MYSCHSMLCRSLNTLVHVWLSHRSDLLLAPSLGSTWRREPDFKVLAVLTTKWPAPLRPPLNTLTSKKRNLTRQFNSLGKLTGLATTSPSADAADEVKEGQKRFSKAFDEAMEAADEVISLSTQQAGVDTVEIYKDDQYDRFEQMQERVLATLKDIQAPRTTPAAAPAPAASGGGARQNTKLVDALKPNTLTKDFNPVEFKAWSKRFRAYYATAGMENLNVQIQQSLWRALIDPNLDVKVATMITDRTPIFGNGGCMALLEQEFAEAYPLATRRADYFHRKQ